MNKIDRKQKLNDLCDELCRSRMYDEANSYKCSVATLPEIIKTNHNPNHAYHDFLAGWRAAMSVKYEELLEENEQLHQIVLDLCAKTMLKRCEDCKGLCIDVTQEFDVCKTCNGEGYVDI